MPKNRQADYRRAQRKRVISRKKHIIRAKDNYWNVPHDGMLSKGKIHCSCWMCRNKSYDSAKPQDIRNAQRAIYEMVDEAGTYGDAGHKGARHVHRRTVTNRRIHFRDRSYYHNRL